jgi:predicted amidohydrolase YtcJ
MPDSSPDLVLFNGKIYTQDATQPLVTSIALHGERIVFIGDDRGALDLLSRRTPDNAVDLHGACALPGLTDAHLHFQWFSLGLQQVNAETDTLEEALQAVSRHASPLPDGAWVTGTGWNHNAWGGDFPTAADLDRAAPEHPVALDAKSKHAAWVNTRALALAGIDAHTPDPAGGKILRLPDGRPSGILLESAIELVKRAIPDPSVDELAAAMRAGMHAAHRAGLTGVHCMDGALALRAFQALHQNGELTLRVTKSLPLENLDAALAVGLRSGFGDDWLRIGGVKMFADGALGPRTAWMLADYEGDPGNTGISTTPVEALYQAVLRANQGGLAANIHAIGDRANREVLDIYARVRAQLGPSMLRNRIEHVQLLDPQDAGRLAELGVIASMQPIHATSDMRMADRFWGARSAHSYALKTQIQRGAVLALGSDCPVETLDPLQGLHAAVTRRRADGSPGPEGWYPAQRLSLAEALRGYTMGPAYAAGMQDRLGTLSPGSLADLTVLDRDLFAIDAMEILHAQVLATVTGGRFVYRSETL